MLTIAAYFYFYGDTRLGPTWPKFSWMIPTAVFLRPKNGTNDEKDKWRKNGRQKK